MKICDYGCGQEAKFQFKNGKWCCSKYIFTCSHQRKKIYTKDRNENISKSRKGKPLNDKQYLSLIKSAARRKGIPFKKETLEKSRITKENNYQIKKNSYDPNRKIIDFRIIDSEVKAYLLGFIYADGCVWFSKDSRNRQFKIRLSIKDKDHLIKIGRYFNKVPREYKTSIHNNVNYDNKKITRYDRDYKCVSLDCSDRMLIEQLIEKGIYSSKSKNDRSSDAFDCISSNFKHHFIRGMVDGDGCFSINKKYNFLNFSLCGANNIILEKINNEISIKCNLKKHDVYKLWSNCYNFQYWKKEDIVKIYQYLYDDATIFLERKKEIIKNFVLKEVEK